jgi:L-asparaginase
MKKILWLQTGGTISCRETSDGLSPSAGKPDAEGFVPDGILLDVRTVFALDSTDITPRHWQMLAQAVSSAREEYSGFVISHGTDTLQYSAAALSLMLADLNKPVVFTGAMKPFSEPDSDAHGNLSAAFTAARDLESGVHAAFAGKLMNGLSCVKVHTGASDAFIDTGHRGGTERYFSADSPLCEDVFYLKVTPNVKADIADFILEKSYRGVVCEVFGLGGIPKELLERLGELVWRGVRVAAVSACLYGGADFGVYAAHRRAREAGLEAWDMTGSAALVKLMLELGADD